MSITKVFSDYYHQVWKLFKMYQVKRSTFHPSFSSLSVRCHFRRQIRMFESLFKKTTKLIERKRKCRTLEARVVYRKSFLNFQERYDQQPISASNIMRENLLRWNTIHNENRTVLVGYVQGITISLSASWTDAILFSHFHSVYIEVSLTEAIAPDINGGPMWK